MVQFITFFCLDLKPILSIDSSADDNKKLGKEKSKSDSNGNKLSG